MTEGPYKLPEGWRWVKLGEVAWREANLLKPSEEPSKRFRYIGMEQVKSGQWEEPQPIEVEGHEIKSQVVKFRPGIVLYGRLRPYLNKVAVPLFEGVASTEFVPIATRQDVLISHYLGAFLRSPAFVTYASHNTTGSRQPRVRYEALWEALIPLPPLSEQQRIVAKVEALLEQIREARILRQKACEDTDRLWQTVLTDAFPRPGTDLPPNWRWVKLGEVFVLRNGKFIRKSRLGNSGDIRVYGSNGLIGYTRGVEPIIHTNTIVIGRVGTCGAVNIALAPSWVSDNAMYVCEWLTDCDLSYIALVLQHYNLGAFPKQGAQPSISQSEVYQRFIPLSSLEEQRRIVAYLEAVREKVKALKEGQVQTGAELQRLEQSILDSAFKGEL